MSLDPSAADHPAMPEPLPPLTRLDGWLTAWPDEEILLVLAWTPPYVQLKVINPRTRRQMWRYYIFSLVGTLDTGTETAPDTPRFFLARDALEGLQPPLQAFFLHRTALEGLQPPLQAFFDAPAVRGLTVIPLIAWHRRVWYRDLRPYLDARWRPETGLCVTLQGDILDVKTDELHQLISGRDLFWSLPQGRPPNRTKRNQIACLHDAEIHYRTYLERMGEVPSLTEIASLVGISERTLRTYIRTHHWPWPPA